MRKLDAKRLAGFEPQAAPAKKADPATPVAADEKSWVSRAPQTQTTFTLRADIDDVARFKRLSVEDRRKHGDMLRMMIDAYEDSIKPR